MIPAAFDYHAPASLAEAVGLLARHGDEAKILSGGQSLIPMMKLRLATPRHVVDINRIPGLAYVRETDGVLAIGALARESDLEASDAVRTRYPILADTCRVVADPLVRNLATICGNLAHGDPANDHPATMLALGAEVVAVGPRGERKLPVSGFFTGPFATALAPDEVAVGPRGERRLPVASFFTGLFATALRPDEILTEIRIPAPPPRSGGAYLKLERKVGDFATAAVAAQVTLAADGTCSRAAIGLTNVGPTAILARRAAAHLQGKRPDDASVREAGRLAAEEADPSDDLRGPVAYKRDLVRVLTARALRRAAERAGAGR